MQEVGAIALRKVVGNEKLNGCWGPKSHWSGPKKSEADANNDVFDEGMVYTVVHRFLS